jgi:hypothetical protein
MRPFLVFEKLCGFGLSEISFEKPRLRFREVHDNQSVQGIRELRIEIESEQLAAQLEILPKQDRNTGARWFQIRDAIGKILEIDPSAGGKGVWERRLNAFRPNLKGFRDEIKLAQSRSDAFLSRKVTISSRETAWY